MFAVAVYNLYTGMEVCRSEDSSMKKILEEYNVLKKHFKNYCSSDCFGILLYGEDGTIIYGFCDENGDY